MGHAARQGLCSLGLGCPAQRRPLLASRFHLGKQRVTWGTSQCLTWFTQLFILLSEASLAPPWDALLTSTRPLCASLSRPGLHSWSSPPPGMSGHIPPSSGPPSGRGSLNVTAGPPLLPLWLHLPGHPPLSPEELLLLEASPNTGSSCPTPQPQGTPAPQGLTPVSTWMGRESRRVEVSLLASLLLCAQPCRAPAQEPVPKCLH